MVLEVVIAYYNNVSWKTFLKDLETYNSEYIVKVYNKCKKKYIANRDYIKVEQLVNIGRESETYLTHIINNYNNLKSENLEIKNKIDLLKNQNEKLVEDLRNSKLNYQSLRIGKFLESDGKQYVKKRIDKMIQDLDFCISNLSS